MPLYEYICTACHYEFDEIQKFSDPAIKKCPKCGKNKAEKKISLTSFSLKGEGWYKDGYARPSEKGGDTKKTETPDKSEKKSEDKPTKNTDDKKSGNDKSGTTKNTTSGDAGTSKKNEAKKSSSSKNQAA